MFRSNQWHSLYAVFLQRSSSSRETTRTTIRPTSTRCEWSGCPCRTTLAAACWTGEGAHCRPRRGPTLVLPSRLASSPPPPTRVTSSARHTRRPTGRRWRTSRKWPVFPLPAHRRSRTNRGGTRTTYRWAASTWSSSAGSQRGETLRTTTACTVTLTTIRAYTGRPYPVYTTRTTAAWRAASAATALAPAPAASVRVWSRSSRHSTTCRWTSPSWRHSRWTTVYGCWRWASTCRGSCRAVSTARWSSVSTRAFSSTSLGSISSMPSKWWSSQSWATDQRTVLVPLSRDTHQRKGKLCRSAKRVIATPGLARTVELWLWRIGAFDHKRDVWPVAVWSMKPSQLSPSAVNHINMAVCTVTHNYNNY